MKESERKGGRVLRSADEIEKEMSEIISNGKDDEIINIDDI